MTAYTPDLTVRAARELLFARGGFTESEYAARVARFRLGRFSFWMPNSPARARALPYHDVHHVVTGYDTMWRGEAEIAAWELASGCRSLLTVWAINLGAMAIGLAIAPRAVFRAFVRGRQSENLYGRPLAAVLDESVAAVRDRLLPGHPTRPSAADRGLFALAGAAGVLLLLAPAAVVVALF